MKWTKLCGYFAFLATFSTACFAEDAEKKPQFSDGKGYFIFLKDMQEPLLENGKLRLRSFFSFDCAACVSANDYIVEYAKRHPEKVEIERYPAILNGNYFTAKMHATFLEIGRPELSEIYLFDSEGRKGESSLMTNEAAVEKWLREHDVDVARFKQTYISPAVLKRVEEYDALNKKYAVIVSPFLGVNGKYILTQNTLYNDDYTYAVLDFLYEKERAAQQEKK